MNSVEETDNGSCLRNTAVMYDDERIALMCGAEASFFYYIVGYPRVMMYILSNSRSDFGEWWYVCLHTSVMTMVIGIEKLMGMALRNGLDSVGWPKFEK
jgi:hypothetical protein